MNTERSKKGQPTFLLDDTPDAPSNRSNRPRGKALESSHPPLDDVKAVIIQKEVLRAEFIPIADDLNKSLQKQILLERALL